MTWTLGVYVLNLFFFLITCGVAERAIACPWNIERCSTHLQMLDSPEKDYPRQTL
jgi:hypothetical protein